MRIGMTPAFDLGAYERSQNLQRPAVAVLAAESTPGRATHDL